MSIKAVDGNGFTKLCYTTAMNLSYFFLLTCHDFGLDKLREGVAWTVLAAALGKEHNICGVLESKNELINGAGYNWTVQTGSKLIYAAKKSGEPTPTDYDFKIELSGGNEGNPGPRVWVEDAEKASCDAMRDALRDATEYQNYDLKIYLDSTENACIGDYGSAKGGELLRAVKSNKPYYAYLTGCVSGAVLCNTAMALASGGTSLLASMLSGAGDIMGCAAGSMIGKYLTPMLVESAIGEDHDRMTQSVLPLLAIGGGGVIAYKSVGMMQTKLFLLHNPRLPSILRNTASNLEEAANVKQAVEVVGETAEDKTAPAIRAVLGLDESAGDLADALTDQSKRKAAADRLKELAKVLRGTDDELADQLDDAARELLKGEKGVRDALQILRTALGKADALKNLADQLEKAMKAAKQTRTQAFVCGAVSQSMGAVFGSITAMTQVASADILAVQITPKDLVNIGFSYDLDLHKMIVAG